MTLQSLCLALTLIAPGQDAELYSDYFGKAEKAKAKGDYASMEANLTMALRHGPGNEYAWRSLAWAQMLQGKWQSALANSKENIKRNGETTWSLKQLFAAAVEAGDLALAKESVDREAKLPASQRDSKMDGERGDLARLTRPTVLDISWKIEVQHYRKKNGVMWLQAPLSDHLWQKAVTTVEGVKDWKLVRDGRWDVLVVKPGDAKEFVVRSRITHRQTPIGYQRFEGYEDNPLPKSMAPLVGPFINGSAYDPKDPLLKDLVKELKGRNAAETVQNILDWMARNMRYEFGHSDALEAMLSSHRGVCHHYSNFTVTLARACGVPAVVAHGMHFPDRGTFKDQAPSHGWVEVYLGKMGWVPCDPLGANTLRTFRAAGYVIVDTSGYSPTDNHFDMRTSDGNVLQAIQGSPGSGSAECK